jgi:hypothetical protein
MLISFTLARLAATALLFWALMPNPPGYYQLLRVAVATVCIFGVYCANRWNQHGWIFIFGWLAILFNPIYPVSLPSLAWAFIDIAVAAVMVTSLFYVRPNREKLPTPAREATH